MTFRKYLIGNTVIFNQLDQEILLEKVIKYEILKNKETTNNECLRRKNMLKNNYGKTEKEIRKASGLSLSAFQDLGISPVTLSYLKMEKGNLILWS